MNAIKLDPERVTEMQERATFYRGAANQAVLVAEALAKGGLAFGRKVFLSDLASALHISLAGLQKLAAYWHLLGWVELVRLDLRHDAELNRKAELSEISLNESTYSCIVVNI